MDIFLKAAAGILVTVVIGLILSKQGNDFSTVLIILVCSMVVAVAIHYFQQIIDFIHTLEAKGNLNGELIKTMFKTVGIALLSEIISMICADSGNSALGKALQILSTAVILWLCIPMFTELIELAESILGAV